MAKLTGGQREYFRERIGQSFASKLAPLEKVAAVKKSELVDDKFDEFIGELGLRKSLDELKRVEYELMAVQQTIANHMENLKAQYDLSESTYRKDYKWAWGHYGTMVDQVKQELLKMCRKECEILFKSIPEGQEIEKLKNKKREAIDYIMGYDQQKELLDGLAHLLTGSGIQMLEEHKE